MVVESCLTIIKGVSQNGPGAFLFLSNRSEEIAVDCGDVVCFNFGVAASRTSLR